MPQHLTVRFVIMMALLAGTVLYLSPDEALGSFLAPLTEQTARITLELIRWSGMEAVREGNIILNPGGFAYEIDYSCTGFFPVGFFSIFVLGYGGAAIKQKAIGLLVCIPILVMLNFVRLVHLFYVGVHQPEIFDMMHVAVWDGMTALVFIGLWLAWAFWSQSREEAENAIAKGTVSRLSIVPKRSP